jgi:hypothetical protein
VYEAVWLLGVGEPLIEGGILGVGGEVPLEQETHGIAFTVGKERGEMWEGRRDREGEERG